MTLNRSDVDASPSPAELSRLSSLLAKRDQELAALRADLDAAVHRGTVIADLLVSAEDLAQIGNWRHDTVSGTTTWSPMMYRLFGRSPTEPGLTLQELGDYIHPDDLPEIESVLRSAVTSSGVATREFRIVVNGKTTQVRGSCRVEHRDTGRLLIGCIQDITDVNATARDLQRSQGLFAGVLNAAHSQAILALDPFGKITAFSAGAQNLLGYLPHEVMGRSAALIHDDDPIRRQGRSGSAAEALREVLAQAANEPSAPRPCTYVAKGGARIDVLESVNPVRAADGAIEGFVQIGTDISALSRAQAALRASEQQFRDTFENAPNGMMLISVTAEEMGQFLKVNNAFARLTGFTEAELLNKRMIELVDPSELDQYEDRVAELLAGTLTDLNPERHWRRKDGSSLWVQLNLNSSVDVEGRYMVAQVEDISDRKQRREQLTFQALHDWLTNLPNRVLLMDRIQHALATSTRTKLQVGVLYVDLDGFKAVNDTVGHAGGDRALVQVAERLLSSVRPSDTVARLGGDEFVIVCGELHDANAAGAIAERVLTRLRAPHRIAGHSFSVGASIGISMSAPTSSPAEMLHQADQAMYVAKRSGRGHARFAPDTVPGSSTG